MKQMNSSLNASNFESFETAASTSVFENDGDEFAEDMSNALSCGKCKQPYSLPKILPGCAHSFCLDCVFKIADGNANEVVCPECKSVSRIGPKGPQGFKTNLSLQRLVDTFRAHSQKSVTHLGGKAANGSSAVSSEQAPCLHVLLTKSRLSCRHCGQKFCQSCEILHKDFLKSEILATYKNFAERLENALALAEPTQKICRDFVEKEANEQTEKAVTDCKRLLEQISSIIEKKQTRILNEIMCVRDAKLAEIDEIVRKGKEAEIPQVIKELPFKPPLAVTLDEVSDIHQQTMQAEKQLQALETLGTSVSSGRLVYQENEAVIEKTALETIDSLLSAIPQIYWQTAESFEHDIAEKEAIPTWQSAIMAGDIETAKDVILKHKWSDQNRRFIVESTLKFDPELNYTALMQAATEGNLDLVKFLVETCHANIFAKSLTGNNAAHLAAYNGHKEVLEYLCHLEPKLRTLGDRKNASILHLAAGAGHVEIVDFIVKENFGEDLKLFSASHRTPLHYAALSGAVECVERLLTAGANPSEVDTKGRTCLHLAVAHDMKNVVKLLIKRCPELVPMSDYSGKTARELAQAEKKSSLIDLFNGKTK